MLESVDAERAGRKPSHRARAGRASVLAFVAVVAVVAVVALRTTWRGSLRNGEPEAAMAPAETTVDVTPADGARFTRASTGNVDRFELSDGAIRLHVRHAPGGRRVVVILPDGEIEDIGTVFEVAVTNGHTERVGVQEGRVVLRLADQGPVTLGAGEAWHRPPAPVAAPVVVEADPSVAPVSRAAVLPRPVAAPKPVVANVKSAAEDEAYLDVLRLLREGHDAEARTAAEAYLEAFPAGFRREEMKSVARAR